MTSEAIQIMGNHKHDSQPLAGKKILALTSEFPPFRGGIGTYAFNMAKAAAELGADVTVVAPDYGDPSIIDDGPYRVIRYHAGVPKTKEFFSRVRFARSAIRQREYDIVHAMDLAFFIPVALSAGFGPRRIFMLHGSEINHMAKRRQHPAHTLSGVFSARSEFIANSAYTLGLLQQKFPKIKPLSRQFAHLGVDPFWAMRAERSALVRSRFGIPPEKFFILAVGRLTPRKGQVHVLEALNTLPEAIRQRIAYVAVGSEIDKAYTVEVDASIERAKFMAKRMADISNEDLRLLYANADAFCLVGQDAGDETVEGFGLVYLEAASQRLPAIAGAIGAVPEVVLDRVTGLLVPPNDRNALANAVSLLMADVGLQEDLAEGAHQHALGFTWRECARITYEAVRHPK